jgi:hypothetical protein
MLRTADPGLGHGHFNDDKLGVPEREHPSSLKRTGRPLLFLWTLRLIHPRSHILPRFCLQLAAYVRSRSSPKPIAIPFNGFNLGRVPNLSSHAR